MIELNMSPYQNQEIHLYRINLVVNIKKGLLAMSPSIDLFCFNNYFVTFGLKKTKSTFFATVAILRKFQHVTGVSSL